MVEKLVGLTLSDDIGEWVVDGVVLCRVVNILHPGTIQIIHTPPEGQVCMYAHSTRGVGMYICTLHQRGSYVCMHTPPEG